MSSLPRIDRRRALHMLAALGTALVVSTEATAAEIESCGHWLSEDVDWEALQTLGREYVALRAGDAGIVRMAALVAAAQSDDIAIAALQDLMSSDYASGRIVRLSHWFVSETEGRIFALLADCAH